MSATALLTCAALALAGLARAGTCVPCGATGWDHALDEFPALPNEQDDTARIQRAIDATPSGVLYVPKGLYRVSSPIVVTNLCSLDLHRAVIATGGSVVYRERSMAHLKQLGNVFFLDVPLEVILERIAMNPDRGIAIAPGQTIGDLFREREALYRKYADFRIDASGLNAQECAWLIIDSWRRNCPETPEI